MRERYALCKQYLQAAVDTPNRSLMKKLLILSPSIGTGLFAILYFIATLYYPGGSQFDKNSIGFSWNNNYWFNLLNEEAINGQPNTAQPIALTAMLILCIALTSFWLQFPKHTKLDKNYQMTIQVCGTVAMTIGFFLFTEVDHDLIINLSSLFGIFTVVGTLFGLRKKHRSADFKPFHYFISMCCSLAIV